MKNAAHTTPVKRPTPSGRFVALYEQVAARMQAIDSQPVTGFVACDLATVHGALQRVVDEGLARGPLFCEWGSGLGAAAALASMLGLDAHGIEIHPGLVASSRELADDLGLDMAMVAGTFLLPGDEDLLVGTRYADGPVNTDAYDQLGHAPEDIDVVFTYPWPSEEALADELFLRHSTPGALLLTFHDADRLLVQRHVAGKSELQPVGWM